MACISLSNTIKVDFVQELDSQAVVNSMYFMRSAAWSEAEATLLAADAKTWWDTRLAPFLTTAIELNMVRVTDLTDPDGFIIEYTAGLPIGGDQATEPLPSNVAIVVSFRSGLRGRRNRGRNYLAAIPNASVNTNAIDGTVASGLVTAYELLQADFLMDYDAGHVIYSCRNIDSPTALAGVSVPVTSYVVNPIVASQRRRLPGRGS